MEQVKWVKILTLQMTLNNFIHDIDVKLSPKFNYVNTQYMCGNWCLKAMLMANKYLTIFYRLAEKLVSQMSCEIK